MHFHKAFLIFLALTAALYFVMLELSRNTLLGWGIALALFIGFLLLHGLLLYDKSAPLRVFAWAVFIVALVAVMKFTAPPERTVRAYDTAEPAVTPIRTVEEGDLTGVFNADRTVEIYAGVPFAKPPVGELRWKEPEKPEHWDGVRACDTYAPMSMQPRGSVLVDSLAHVFVYKDFRITTKDNWVEAMSEDSLYLNIWKPAGDIENAPVVVYIHGGSLTTGQSAYRDHRGEAYAKQGVIFISIAYRLNVFGFYADEELAGESPNATTGNYGLLDQIRALEWIRDNIAAFGGDPEKVTIAGESAGASCVNALCVSPLAKGLFRYAIAESSGITAKVPYHTFRSFEDALKAGTKLRTAFGVKSVAELRNLPAKELVNTNVPHNSMTVDGYVITEQPYLTYLKGNNNEQALLNGFDAHEADVFVATTKVTADNYEEKLKPLFGDLTHEAALLIPPAERAKEYTYFIDAGGNAKGSYNELVSAAWFDYSHYNWSRLLTAQGKPVYEYYFTKDNGSIGSIHSGEIPYAYGNLLSDEKLYSAADHALSEKMVAYWLNFIRTGDPNGEGLPEWKKFGDDPTLVMELGDNVGMITDKYLPVYELIDRWQDMLEEKQNSGAES